MYCRGVVLCPVIEQWFEIFLSDFTIGIKGQSTPQEEEQILNIGDYGLRFFVLNHSFSAVAPETHCSRKQDLRTCRTRLTVEDMCRDQWKWASQNPNGYGDQAADE